MSGFENLAYAVAVIAAMILGYFGIRLTRRPDTRLKGVLMVVMALVLVANVAILTV